VTKRYVRQSRGGLDSAAAFFIQLVEICGQQWVMVVKTGIS